MSTVYEGYGTFTCHLHHYLIDVVLLQPKGSHAPAMQCGAAKTVAKPCARVTVTMPASSVGREGYLQLGRFMACFGERNGLGMSSWRASLRDFVLSQAWGWGQDDAGITWLECLILFELVSGMCVTTGGGDMLVCGSAQVHSIARILAAFRSAVKDIARLHVAPMHRELFSSAVGSRYRLRSLGVRNAASCLRGVPELFAQHAERVAGAIVQLRSDLPHDWRAVSYTHLTLPTICSV
eukprot:5322807-Alexandrium_andersonii.AAC.1